MLNKKKRNQRLGCLNLSKAFKNECSSQITARST